tara:strand:+ start:4750 stop:6120 length:1371 start_codon:yes stop_codon:yes gene_type:complete
MNSYKKVGLLSAMWMFLVTMLSQLALALSPQDIIKEIVTLQFLSRVGLQNVGDPLEGLIRFLLLIALFAIFYKGAEALKLGRNIAITLAAVFSIISTIFIPSTILIAAGASLGTLFGVILLVIPLGSLIMMYKFFNDSPWMRVFILAVQAVVLWEMNTYITGSKGLAAAGGTYGTMLGDFGPYIMAIFWLTIVLLIFESFKLFPSSSTTSSGGSGFLGFLKRRYPSIGNFKKNVRGTKAHEEHQEHLKTSHREKTRLLSDYIEEKKEMHLISEAKKDTEAFVDVIAKAQSDGKAGKSAFKASFQLAHDSIHHARTEVKKLRRTTFRAERELNKLMKEVRSKNIQGKIFNRKRVQTYEADLLKIHDDIMKELKKIDDEMGNSGSIKKNLDDFNAHTGNLQGLGRAINGGANFGDRMDKIREGLNKVHAALGIVETEQHKSYTEVENLIAATKEFWDN